MEIDTMTTNTTVPAHLVNAKQLLTYTPEQQLYGQWLSGYPWRLYCTGTFRMTVLDDEAKFMIQRFVNGLREALHFKYRDMAFYAAIEHGVSGLGLSGTKLHTHFVLSCPDNLCLLSTARVIWRAANGLGKFELYDPERAGTYYLSKLIANGATTLSYNMDKLVYTGDEDIMSSMKRNIYVRERLRDKTTGRYLIAKEKATNPLAPELSISRWMHGVPPDGGLHGD
jgi:hypothetical protein